ncbi:hypothetical protein HDK64DRAFT_255422 [Phyllosticta capitalensis]
MPEFRKPSHCCRALWDSHDEGNTESAFRGARCMLENHTSFFDDEHLASLHMLLSRSNIDAVSHLREAVELLDKAIRTAYAKGRYDRFNFFKKKQRLACEWLREAEQREAREQDSQRRRQARSAKRQELKRQLEELDMEDAKSDKCWGQSELGTRVSCFKSNQELTFTFYHTLDSLISCLLLLCLCVGVFSPTNGALDHHQQHRSSPLRHHRKIRQAFHTMSNHDNPNHEFWRNEMLCNEVWRLYREGEVSAAFRAARQILRQRHPRFRNDHRAFLNMLLSRSRSIHAVTLFAFMKTSSDVPAQEAVTAASHSTRRRWNKRKSGCSRLRGARHQRSGSGVWRTSASVLFGMIICPDVPDVQRNSSQNLEKLASCFDMVFGSHPLLEAGYDVSITNPRVDCALTIARSGFYGGMDATSGEDSEAGRGWISD